jgi:hypothetical protein
MLERFGVSNDDFVAAVGAASNDAGVVAFVRLHASQTTVDEWNAFVKAREPRGNRNLAEVLEIYPVAERAARLKTRIGYPNRRRSAHLRALDPGRATYASLAVA